MLWEINWMESIYGIHMELHRKFTSLDTTTNSWSDWGTPLHQAFSTSLLMHSIGNPWVTQAVPTPTPMLMDTGIDGYGYEYLWCHIISPHHQPPPYCATRMQQQQHIESVAMTDNESTMRGMKHNNVSLCYALFTSDLLLTFALAPAFTLTSTVWTCSLILPSHLPHFPQDSTTLSPIPLPPLLFVFFCFSSVSLSSYLLLFLYLCTLYVSCCILDSTYRWIPILFSSDPLLDMHSV